MLCTIFSVSSLECFKKGGYYDQSTDQLNMMFVGSQTGGFYYARKELIKLDTSQIWTIILASGIPSALVALLIRRFEARMDAKEKAREKQELLLVKGINASIALGEATAEAVARIPDAHCNGDMHAALDYAKKIKHEQKDFLQEQAVHALV